MQPGLPDGFQQTDGPDARGVARVLRFVEADTNVRLCAEVVDLIRSDLRHQCHQSGAIAQIAVVEKEACILLAGICVEMVDPRCVERGRSSNQAVYFVPLLINNSARYDPS